MKKNDIIILVIIIVIFSLGILISFSKNKQLGKELNEYTLLKTKENYLSKMVFTNPREEAFMSCKFGCLTALIKLGIDSFDYCVNECKRLWNMDIILMIAV